MINSRENFIGSAVLVIEDNTGVKLTIEKVSEIIRDKMDHEWKTFEDDEVTIYMDTSPRENVIELLAQHYLGRGWPTYMDKVNIDDFCTELKEKMKVDAQ